MTHFSAFHTHDRCIPYTPKKQPRLPLSFHDKFKSTLAEIWRRIRFAKQTFSYSNPCASRGAFIPNPPSEKCTRENPYAEKILDSFYPVPTHDIPNTLVIAFSVSGETAEIISMLNGYKQKKARTISITNTEKSTIARMTDLNFSYYMPVICIYSPVRELNMTTSIPVCYLIEALTQKIYEYQKKNFR